MSATPAPLLQGSCFANVPPEMCAAPATSKLLAFSQKRRSCCSTAGEGVCLHANKRHSILSLEGPLAPCEEACHWHKGCL